MTDPTMGEATTAMAERRSAIADAAIELIARGGMRGLTHQAVDHELGLASGSVSFYARTRRQLVHLVLRRLAERTLGDVSRTVEPPTTSVQAADRLAATIEAISARSVDVRARHVLAVELVDDPELHSFVTYASPAQHRLVAAAEQVLTSLGVADPDHHAVSLVAVMDGLLFNRLSGAGVDPAQRADARAVLLAYLTGLPRTTTG